MTRHRCDNSACYSVLLVTWITSVIRLLLHNFCKCWKLLEVFRLKKVHCFFNLHSNCILEILLYIKILPYIKISKCLHVKYLVSWLDNYRLSPMWLFTVTFDGEHFLQCRLTGHLALLATTCEMPLVPSSHFDNEIPRYF